MFIIFLKFSNNKSKAPDFMQAHNAWITEHINSGTFLLVGTLEPKQGGCVLAHCADKDEAKAIAEQDPFVAEDIVTAEIHEISPAKVDDRLSFLLS